MKSGIVILTELRGDLAARVHAVQRQYDPRMAAELPPHITLTGSSGMGPIAEDTSVDALQRALGPIAASTAPITARFETPKQFMQSPVVVLCIDPHGPIRDLHERIKAAGLRHEPPRFAFTPHCTLSFYPELSKARLARLLTERFAEPFVIDRLDIYRTETLTRTRKILELPLAGAASPGAARGAPGDTVSRTKPSVY